jgi:hypothetical protein
VILQQTVPVAEMTVAEGTVTDDALRCVLASLKGALRLPRRHDVW